MHLYMYMHNTHLHNTGNYHVSAAGRFLL